MPLPPVNSPASQFGSFNAVDWGLLAVLAWSSLTALFRGIIREIFGLLGTVLGLLLACWYYPAVAGQLARWISSPPMASAAGFLFITSVVMIACTVVGRIIRGTAHTVGLGLFDRLAGALFGLLRGSAIGVALLMAAAAFLPPQTAVAQSRLAPYFLAAAREVCFVVPQDLRHRISLGIDSLRPITGF